MAAGQLDGAARALVYAALGLVVLGFGAGLVCPGGDCSPPGFDRAGLALLRDWRTPQRDAFFLFLTGLGSLLVLLPLALLLAGQQYRASGQRGALFVPLVLLSTAALVQLSKYGVARPRPELGSMLLAPPADWSYPSGHASHITAFALAWALAPAARGRPRGGPLLAALLLVGLVGLSRVYLQVHYPSDVIFGITATVFWVLAMRALPGWSAPLRA